MNIFNWDFDRFNKKEKSELIRMMEIASNKFDSVCSEFEEKIKNLVKKLEVDSKRIENDRLEIIKLKNKNKKIIVLEKKCTDLQKTLIKKEQIGLKQEGYIQALKYIIKEQSI